MINLKANDWDIVIAPEYGASILKCCYKGRDVLHPAAMDWMDNPDLFRASSFPLVPFSNRIENGEFEFEGRQVQLPQNHPEQAHVIHGFGWTSRWDVSSEHMSLCELVFEHTRGDWPWPFEVTYRFEVSGADFIQSLKLTNVGDVPMPAGLGFHPYFPGRETARIQFNATGIWQSGAEDLPSHWTAQEAAFDFETLTALHSMNYDNCFTGWDGRAQIDWTDRPDRLNISGNHELDHVVLYTPQDQPFFCFEPVTHGNNALANKDVMAKGKTMRLAPGQTKHAEMRISVSE